MAGMSSYPFKCDLCGGVTDAPTYGDFKCQHCGQAYVYDECHQIKLSEPQLQTLRDSRWIAVEERLPDLEESVMVGHAKDGWVCIGSRQLTGEYHHWDGDDFEELHEPTHWKPLPEPPEVK